MARGLQDRLIQDGSVYSKFNGETPLVTDKKESKLHYDYSINGQPEVLGQPEPSILDLNGINPLGPNRDGKEMTFTMKRAAQVNDATREEVIQNLTNWTNFDMRPKIKSSAPLVAEDNVVIGTFQLFYVDPDGNEVTWWNIERFVFNEDGKLVFHADLSEELFLNQQQGYYLTND